MLRWRLPATLLLALVPALTACGDDDQPAASAPSSAAAADRNQADVDFARGMVPHHQQAVEMADLALADAASPEVRDLAQRIKDAQTPEIETMRGWLQAWGEDLTPSDEGTGMMSAMDMDELGAASGAEFDELFLTTMKEHHQSAIEMAQTELDEGQNAEAKALAQSIVDTQRAEIAEIDALLAGMGNGDTGGPMAGG